MNIADNDIDGIITKNAIIQKKAKDKLFVIINNNKKFKLNVTELSNFGTKLFIFLGSLFFSIVGIPMCFKQNELEKEYEKNSR